MSDPFAGIADAPLAAAIRAQAAPATRLDALIDAVLARLKEKLPGSARVERFPDRPEQYDFEGSSAAVLVSYESGAFERGSHPAALFETIRLAVTLLVRSLDGATGAPALLEDIRLALQGASLAGATALTPIDRNLEAASDGVWQFGTSFETRLPAVSDPFHPSMREPLS